MGTLRAQCLTWSPECSKDRRDVVDRPVELGHLLPRPSWKLAATHHDVSPPLP